MSDNPYLKPKSASTADATIAQRSHASPLWHGALLAPLATPLAAVPLAPFLEPPPYEGCILYVVLMSPFVAIISIIYGYIGMMLVGFPTAVILRKLGYLSAPLLCTLSLPLGAAFSLVPALTSPDPVQWQSTLVASLVFGAAALTVAISFCLASGITIRSSRKTIATRLFSA
jgi:hypothetical protein